MATINYTPGQILYLKSSMGPWYYISFLHCAKPVKDMNETYKLYTCCDLRIEEDGSECLTVERNDGSLLDLDTSFDEVREATDVEREYLYKALVRGFKDYDLGWDKHFTDSTYFDILDWLACEFGVETSSDGLHQDSIEIAMYEIQDYIWDVLCKQMNLDNPYDVKSELTGEELLIAWFKKIERMAGERTTEAGFVMDEKTALNEISILARDAAEFVQRYLDVRMD